MENALVILAGGKGERFGKKLPKQFYKIGNQTILDIFISILDTKSFKYIVISAHKKYRKIIKINFDYNLEKNKLIFSLLGFNKFTLLIIFIFP